MHPAPTPAAVGPVRPAADRPPTATLRAALAGRTVSVVIPARDEAGTVGAVVHAVTGPLVDEVLVIDAGSTDDTAAVAAAAGARVLAQAAVLPEHGDRPGKGEAMWKGLAAATGDLVVFVDGDLRDVPGWWVEALLWPLLTDPAVRLVKAAYARPFGAAGAATGGGGRVTELLARPLLAALAPALAALAQPLSGECAAARSTLRALPFGAGYDVEVALLLDVLDRYGPAALAQVDLGVRRHRHSDLDDLSRMAAQVCARVLQRRGLPAGVAAAAAGGLPYPQYPLAGPRGAPQRHWVPLTERPALDSLPGPRAGSSGPGAGVPTTAPGHPGPPR